jgi:hypothetical protein
VCGALYPPAYLVNVLQQINDWLMQKTLQKLVLVITAVVGAPVRVDSP